MLFDNPTQNCMLGVVHPNGWFEVISILFRIQTVLDYNLFANMLPLNKQAIEIKKDNSAIVNSAVNSVIRC